MWFLDHRNLLRRDSRLLFFFDNNYYNNTIVFIIITLDCTDGVDYYCCCFLHPHIGQPERSNIVGAEMVYNNSNNNNYTSYKLIMITITN